MTRTETVKLKGKIDEIDKSILRLLQEDSNMQLKQIAYRLNKSIATISDRIKRLSRLGFIIGSHAVLNRKLLNLGTMGYINLNLGGTSEKEMSGFVREVTKLPGVCECLKLVGKYNTRLKIVTADVTEISRIHGLVANLENVSNADLQLVAEDIIVDKGINF